MGSPKFKTKNGFIWAATGSAVGLGNLWRFPYLVNEFGGGAFLLIYFVLLILFGLILAITDIAIGRKTGKSAIIAFLDLSKKYRWVGILCTLVPIIICAYYCVIGGWIFKYVSIYATNSSEILSFDYFTSFISCGISGIFNSPIFWFVIFALISAIILSFNLNSGLEKVSRYAMPLLLCILVIISIYVFTIPGIDEGLKYYFIPDFSKINADTFLTALGQIFFSLSIATGVLVTFGSYMDKNEDIEKSAFITASIDFLVSILSGMIIVPVVHAFGETVINGSGLMFVILPRIFNRMEFGSIVGLLFFLLAAIAALTSILSMMENLISPISYKFKLGRPKTSVIVFAITLVVGIFPCIGYGPLNFISSYDVYLLEIMDYVSNSFLLPIIAVSTCIFVAYELKFTPIVEEIKLSSPFRSEKIYYPMLKYVAPIIISTIFVFAMIQFFTLPVK